MLHDNGTVHWIYRKASFQERLENHKGGLPPSKWKWNGQGNNSVWGL